MKKHFYMTREKKLVEANLVAQSPYKREIEIEVSKDGQTQTKKLKVHPEGVSWGAMYPRVFTAKQMPSHIFEFKGRAIVQTFHDPLDGNIPSIRDYRFQPFISDVIDSIHAKENIILTGGTGVGKTTHITQLAARIKQPVLRINFNGETRMSDLLGKVSVVNGETLWRDGVIPQAMRNGYWLLLDELDFAEPAVLSLLHPILETDPMLTLKENGGEVIRPHENFRIFATANSIGAMQDRAQAYGGTNEMNEAFLDRWQVLYVDNLPEKEEIRVVKSEVPGINSTMAKRIVTFANKVRSGTLSDDAAYSGDNFSTRKVLAWAKKAALHRDAIKGAQLAWLDTISKDEQPGLLRILMTHFGSKQKRSSNKLKVIKTTTIGGAKKRGRPAKKVA
jgi:MoxR-like ATPase